MDAVANGGVSGADPWLGALKQLIAEEPLCDSLDDALQPLASEGVDVEQIKQVVAAWLTSPEADWPESDWRRTHPGFPSGYAGAIYAYTLPAVLYKPLNAAMRDTGRAGAAFCGCSAELRAWLPYVKYLDTALEEAGKAWGVFLGKCHRGVQWAFPKPTVAEHDPERYFSVGKELNWFEFKSSSTDFDTMYSRAFCGPTGPRTIFTVQNCEGISIKKFSAIEKEEEVSHQFACLELLHKSLTSSRCAGAISPVCTPQGHTFTEKALGGQGSPGTRLRGRVP